MTNIYDLDYLLDRTYEELEQTMNKKTKATIPKPDVSSANKRTFISNFRNICAKLNRNEIDIKNFYDVELRTKSSIDKEGNLIIHGMFQPKGIQKILLGYIKSFIVCPECNATDTLLNKENRINFLTCNICLSKKALIG